MRKLLFSKVFLTGIAATIILTTGAFAEERLVPSEYSTIQAAIDDCNNGDVVIVEPNIYTGAGNRDLDFGGRAITVRSTDPEDLFVVATTVIDCENASGHRGLYFHSGEGPNSIVLGLTITRGRIYSYNAEGGGIYCEGASPTIENCIISDSVAQGDDGSPDGFPAYGGGVYCTSSSHPTIINCTIRNNTALGGYGIYSIEYQAFGGDSFGGGIYCSSDSSVTVVNSTIHNNTAQGGDADGDWPMGGLAQGGGICGAVTISNSVVNNNSAMDGYMGPARGGGIYSGGATVVNNCLIINNVADGFDDDAGGGIYASNLTARNCTVYNNASLQWSQGGGISTSGGSTIIDCILWGNTDDLRNGTATYSCIKDGDAGVGNISSDPCFVIGPDGDFYLSQVAAGQAADSPCVDAGSDTAVNLGMDDYITRTDQEPDSGQVDMGYHYSYVMSAADIDGDGDVDFVDFAILADQWLEEPGEPSADIAPPGGDNIVDGLDLGVLVENWQGLGQLTILRYCSKESRQRF